MARGDFPIGQPSSTTFVAGAGTAYPVFTTGGVYYEFMIDAAADLVWRKSTNGFDWTAYTVFRTGTVQGFAVWYDRWSGIAADVIHVAYVDANDTFYRTLDTASDTASTETTIFDGTSSADGRALTIARSRGGNVYCWTMIDAGAEGAFKKLLNANVPNGAWEAALTLPEALATTDQGILVPGFAADNNDMMLLFWDASANEISRYVYDDSGNSWAETSISASFNDTVATTLHPNWAATVDLTNSQIVLIAWNDDDLANADLACWTVTESAITAKTDVVTNSTDDQGLCALVIDTATGRWTAFYGGKSDGSETFNTLIKIYSKYSDDSGATWSAESSALTSATRSIPWLFAPMRWTGTGTPPFSYYDAQSIAWIRWNIEVPAAAGGGALVGGGLVG